MEAHAIVPLDTLIQIQVQQFAKNVAINVQHAQLIQQTVWLALEHYQLVGLVQDALAMLNIMIME